MKGVGRIYQQTVIDTYSKVAFAKLYDRKNALVAADMLNDRVIPFFDSKEIPRGCFYCPEKFSSLEKVRNNRKLLIPLRCSEIISK